MHYLQVITSVACQRTVYEMNIMKDLREDGMRCFLPTNLHELAMHQGLTAHQAFQEYEFTFLSTAFGCGQVMFLHFCNVKI
ncbi:hypothetical protein LINPERPRIM_LOCUS38344 [Linum perenne]